MMVHRRLLALVGQLWRPMLYGIVIGWLVMAARVAQAALAGVVLSRIFRGDPFSQVRGLLALIAVVIVIRALLVWAREVVAQVAAGQVKEQVRDRLYGQLVRLGPGYLASSRTGQTQSIVVDGVEALEGYFSRYLPQLAVCLTGPLALVAWMFTRDFYVGAAVLVGVLAVPLIPLLWDGLLGERSRVHWDTYAAYGSEYLDSMQGMTTLKSLDAVDVRRRLLRDKGERLYRATMRLLTIAIIDTGLAAFGAQLGVAGAVGIGALRVANHDLDVTTLLVLLMLTGECFRPFAELSIYWHAGNMGVSASEGITELLAAKPAVADRPDAVRWPTEARASVVFEDVTFSYPDRTTPAVQGLSFQVLPGETVAIVGHSGAGKTTVVNLLLRFVPPVTGQVLVGGYDVADLTGDSLRAVIAVVSQDTYLFYGTVADNLRLARPEASDDDLMAAARAANAHEFIASLPQGYATVIGERGLSLSGGQRQRLAIARALLKDAPILVLDEATSAIDAENEEGIVAAVERLSEGRTTLIIAHRLNTVRRADRILVLAGGCLIEQGSHEELMAHDSEYAGLVAAQDGIQP